MDNQMEMILATGGRKVDDIVDQMIAALSGHGGNWVTRKELAVAGLTDRMCRLACQHADGRIIAGQLGYKLFESATVDEICHAANALQSQATAMGLRSQALWRRLHSSQKERQQ